MGADQPRARVIQQFYATVGEASDRPILSQLFRHSFSLEDLLGLPYQRTKNHLVLVSTSIRRM